MPGIRTVTDRAELETYLRRDPFLHLYALGDLDDAFWPLTTWYTLADGGGAERAAERPSGRAVADRGEGSGGDRMTARPARGDPGDGLRAVVLRYEPGAFTAMLALAAPRESAALNALLEALVPALPPRFYCHLSPGAEASLRATYDLVHHGRHLKMALVRSDALARTSEDGVVALGPSDESELRVLYAAAYPETWFDPAMLAKGPYLGLREPGGALVATAGLHVWSPRYRVAALGNIATHPAWRGRGLARRVTAALCRRCLEHATHVGLNVHADNLAAHRLYRSLGFADHAPYDEYDVTARLAPPRRSRPPAPARPLDPPDAAP